MKTPIGQKHIMVNHDLVRVIAESATVTLYIRMKSGQWAVQNPYPNDLRGHIAAMTLAIDVMAGKVMLADTVMLDEKEFSAKRLAFSVNDPNMIDVKKIGN